MGDTRAGVGAVAVAAMLESKTKMAKLYLYDNAIGPEGDDKILGDRG